MPPTHLLVAAPGLRVHRVPRLEREAARVGGGTRWIVVALLLLLGVAAGLGYLRTWPPLATVMSASMAPTINAGDIVVLKRLDAPAAIGDVVMVRVPDDARSRFGYPPVVIHRVVAIAADGTVTTKGDAKKDIDPFTVRQRSITTRVLTHVPAAGQAFGFLSSTLGLLWLAGGAALFFGLPLVERYRDGQRRLTEERTEREHVIEQLRERVELLPAQIERAVASAVAAMPAAASREVTGETPVATGRHSAAGAVTSADETLTAAAGGEDTPAATADETLTATARHVADGDETTATALGDEITASGAPVATADETLTATARRAVAGGETGAVDGGAVAASLWAAPVCGVAAPARVVSAGQVAALALARRTPPSVPPVPPVRPSRFPKAVPAPSVRPARSARFTPRAERHPGVLCAVGGP